MTGPPIEPNATTYLKRQLEEPVLDTWCLETNRKLESQNERSAKRQRRDFFAGRLYDPNADDTRRPNRRNRHNNNGKHTGNGHI